MICNQLFHSILLTLTPLVAADLHIRLSCTDNFSICSPKGASSSGTPAVGASLSTLYVDILDSINKVQNVRRGKLEAYSLGLEPSIMAC